MTDEEVKNNPSFALAFCADKLTSDQFDYCVRRGSSIAIAFCLDRLTEEQIGRASCRERV